MELEQQQHNYIHLGLFPVSNDHYMMDIEVKIQESSLKQIRRHQFVMIAIQFRSGMNMDNFNSFKFQIINLVYQLKQRHVRQIFLFWNENEYCISSLPNSEISQIINNIANEGKKGMEDEFSYTETLVSIRHKISNLQKMLSNKYQLSIIFISTEISVSQLIDMSWEQQYMKWLYGRNKHKQQIQNQYSKLRNKLCQLPCKSTIMSVGFGKYHDSDLLQSLNGLTHNRGVYLSALSINQLRQYLLTLSILASGQITSFGLQWEYINSHNKREKCFIRLSSDEECGVFRRKDGYQFIDRTMSMDMLREREAWTTQDFDKEEQQMVWDIRVQHKMVDDHSLYIKIKCSYLQFLLNRLLVDCKDVIYIQRQKDILNDNRYIYVQYFNEHLMGDLVKQKNDIEDMLRQLDETTKSIKMGKKAQLMERINDIRDLLIKTNQTFANIYNKKFSYLEIGQLIGQASKNNLKRSLKKKLLKRINANPNLLAQVYGEINNILQKISLVDIEAKYSHLKSNFGNFGNYNRNFAKIMFNEDCIGVPFQIYRPKSSIADPGRIKIKAVHHYPVSTGEFMWDYGVRDSIRQGTTTQRKSTFLDTNLNIGWKIQDNQVMYFQKPKTIDIFSDNLIPGDFQIEGYGVFPLYICQQNWSIAKRMMKPALGWSVCCQPLAYTTSQLQTVPFLLLEAYINESQMLKYELQRVDEQIEQFYKDQQKVERAFATLNVQSKHLISQDDKVILSGYFSESRFDKLSLNAMRKQMRQRLDQYSQSKLQLRQTALNSFKQLIQLNESYLKMVEETCCKIIEQLSGPKAEQPFGQSIVKKFKQYEQPINRTIDVINNNFAFLSQIYCAIKLKLMPLPSEQDFHYFFQRLVEEELRRQTFGWKQEYEEECFVNKLLNVQIQKINQPTVVAVGSTFRERFLQYKKGHNLKMNQIQQKRNTIQLNLKKQDSFNPVQRMVFIQYKRLYEATALRLWYLRFRLYKEVQKKLIHKWKSVGVLNAYNMFTMVIQNKTQRKNATRRQVILAGQYVDPFDYQECVDFIQKTFNDLRQKVIRRNMQETIAQIFKSQVQTFALTNDATEAAGVLLDNSIGKNIYKYYNALYDEHSPIIHLKLNMILKGSFEGVQLFTHKGGWDMSKQKIARLNKKYPHQFDRFRWMI